MALRGDLVIRIDRALYKAHQLAVLYVTGRWPKEQVDHENGVRHQNNWGNLREATNSQNNANRGMRPCNTSGFKNVSFYPGLKRPFTAYGIKSGRKVYLGRFETAIEAAAAADAAGRQEYGEFWRAG